MKDRCRRDPIYVSLSARIPRNSAKFREIPGNSAKPGKFVDRRFCIGNSVPKFRAFCAKSMFLVEDNFSKNRIFAPSGTPIFVKKVARCVQIPFAFRFSGGLRLSCRKNRFFASSWLRLVDFYVVYS